MNIRKEIASVTLTKVQNFEENKYTWSHTQEQEHARTAVKTLEKTAKCFNKYITSSSPSDLRIIIEKTLSKNILTITLVLYADHYDEDSELFTNQAEAFTKEIQTAFKDALAALNRAVEIGGAHPNRISIMEGSTANISGLVTTTFLAANVANGIRSCAHDFNGLQLTFRIEEQKHELSYTDTSAAFLDEKNIKESHGDVMTLSRTTTLAGIKPDGMRTVDLTFKQEHRSTLAKSWDTYKPISFLWASKIKYRNGEPIIVGGQIIDVSEPLVFDLKSKK